MRYLESSAYDKAGGFPNLDDGEEAQLVHSARPRRLWASTDRTCVRTSSRREGRSGNGFARFLRRLDDAVATFGATEELEQRLRTQILRLAHERGPDKTLCPSEAAGAVDPARRQSLTQVARAVACTLADEGVVVITQKGSRSTGDDSWAGPGGAAAGGDAGADESLTGLSVPAPRQPLSAPDACSRASIADLHEANRS